MMAAVSKTTRKKLVLKNAVMASSVVRGELDARYILLTKYFLARRGPLAFHAAFNDLGQHVLTLSGPKFEKKIIERNTRTCFGIHLEQ